MGLLNALQGELAQALVERDMLLTYAADADQRVRQANRRIDAITDRIEEERANLGVAGVRTRAASCPRWSATYEALQVDLEFANTAYTQALANLAVARAEARRQSRYLAAHVEPTMAESALYPRRATLRADGALPAARLGRADARLLQCARQPLSGAAGRGTRRDDRIPRRLEVLPHPAGRKVVLDHLTSRCPGRQGGRPGAQRRRQVDDDRHDRGHRAHRSAA